MYVKYEQCIVNLKTGQCISYIDENKDYQDFLSWEKAGGKCIDSSAVEASNAGLDLLTSTDWKCMRHMNQLALGSPTSLTNDEYGQLLKDRQAARDAVIDKDKLS